jgi:AcrR family transcriptional regulator
MDPAAVTDWDSLLAHLEAQPAGDGWVTLDEAAAAAGVSRSTLRSWYRSSQLPSRMVPGPHGPQRLVPLDAVVDRAMRSSRIRRQLDAARGVDAEVAELRRRVRRIEQLLGIDAGR